MQERIEELRKSFSAALAAATDADSFESLRVEYLGNN